MISNLTPLFEDLALTLQSPKELFFRDDTALSQASVLVTAVDDLEEEYRSPTVSPRIQTIARLTRLLSAPSLDLTPRHLAITISFLTFFSSRLSGLDADIRFYELRVWMFPLTYRRSFLLWWTSCRRVGERMESAASKWTMHESTGDLQYSESNNSITWAQL